MRFKKYLKEEIEIYLDMDGVITDFDAMCLYLLEYYNGMYKKEPEKFWEIIKNNSPKFWENMPWTFDGKELYKYLKNNFKKITILSAHPQTGKNVCKIGKAKWIKRELGNISYIFCYGIEKQLYAKDNAILIDDSKRNIKQWEKSGGIGVLHKRSIQTIGMIDEYITSWKY